VREVEGSRRGGEGGRGRGGGLKGGPEQTRSVRLSSRPVLMGLTSLPRGERVERRLDGLLSGSEGDLIGT
jgi:hypothetical protein